jgi:hypothetical protein
LLAELLLHDVVQQAHLLKYLLALEAVCVQLRQRAGHLAHALHSLEHVP